MYNLKLLVSWMASKKAPLYMVTWRCTRRCVGSCLYCSYTPEYAKDYEIDARPVVVPATRGRIIRYRPRLDQWKVDFLLEDDDGLLSATQTRQILDDTGLRVGLLEFRPEKKGPFGRFKVTHWEKQR